jgi:hypothetical protein
MNNEFWYFLRVAISALIFGFLFARMHYLKIIKEQELIINRLISSND